MTRQRTGAWPRAELPWTDYRWDSPSAGMPTGGTERPHRPRGGRQWLRALLLGVLALLGARFLLRRLRGRQVLGALLLLGLAAAFSRQSRQGPYNPYR